MRTIIIDAIQERRRLFVDYDPGHRVIEPHAFGLGSDGQELLRAFQVSGATHGGDPHNWKMFRCDEIRVLGDAGSFEGPRPGYRRGDRHMKGGIIAEL
jgi:hypothetical protein